MMVSKVRGFFTEFSGDVEVAEVVVDPGVVVVVVAGLVVDVDPGVVVVVVELGGLMPASSTNEVMERLWW